MHAVVTPLREWLAGLRQPPDRQARLRAALLWAVLATPVLAQAGVRAASDSSWWPLFVGVLALAGTVRISRNAPVLALLTSAALVLIDPSFAWAPPVMSYLVGRRVYGVRAPAIGFACILVAGVVLGVLGIVSWGLSAFGFAVLGLLPWLLGRYRQQRVALVHAGWQRAEHLEREQRIAAEQARLRERARISRDMHDSLGHELSLIALLAGRFELTAGTDIGQRATAQELRQRAAAATERLREIIGVLREDAEASPTEPRSDDVPGLVQRCRDAGMTVTLHMDDEVTETPPLVDLAAFRVVQEALTNAAKHAPAAAVSVWVSRAQEHTTVTVCNAVAHEAATLSTQSGSEHSPAGQGLIGLAERARMLGGTVNTRARAGTFEVIAELPHVAVKAPSADSGLAGQSPTESALQRAEAQHRVRRSLIVAVAGSALTALLIMAAQVFVWIYNTERSYLSQERFGQVTVGHDRARTAQLLPPEQIAVRLGRPEPPIPENAVCEYYSGEDNPFGTGPVYRLCFADGSLVSKDILLAGGDNR